MQLHQLFIYKQMLSCRSKGRVLSTIKKNYTLDLLNSEGKSLAVKFGDMIAADSFHLKGFYRDPSHFRDQGAIASGNQ